MSFLGRDKQFFDKDKFREDVKPFLSEQDAELLVHLYEARRIEKDKAIRAVALLLGLTVGQVAHRALKAVDYFRRLAGYAVLFERILDGVEAEPDTPKSN